MDSINIYYSANKTFSKYNVNLKDFEESTEFINILNKFNTNKEIQKFPIFIHIKNDSVEFIDWILKKLGMETRKKIIQSIYDSDYLDLDHILQIDENSTFINLRYITFEKKVFLQENSKIKFKINKHPIKIFLINKLYFIIEKCKESFKFDFVLNIFKNKLLFIQKDSLNILQSNTTDEIFNCMYNKKTFNNENNFYNIYLPFTNFHEYELKSKNLQAKKIIEKIKSLQNELEEPDDSIDYSMNTQFTDSKQFNLEGLFYWLLFDSFDTFAIIGERLYEEGEELKETYLHLQENLEKRKFYNKMSRLEESVLMTSQETNIKAEFFKSFLKKLNKIFFPSILANVNTQIFTKNLTLYIEQLLGKIREIKLILKNLQNSIKMMKKTFRIILDDNQRKTESKMNTYLLYLTIISALILPVLMVFQFFAMNIEIPLQDYDNVGPFMLIAVSATLLFGIYFIILVKWDWKYKNIKCKTN